MQESSAQCFEDIIQLSVTFHLDTALKQPSLYASYIEVLDTLTSLGFQIFNVKMLEVEGQVYEEPLLENRKVSLRYIVAFVRT